MFPITLLLKFDAFITGVLVQTLDLIDPVSSSTGAGGIEGDAAAATGAAEESKIDGNSTATSTAMEGTSADNSSSGSLESEVSLDRVARYVQSHLEKVCCLNFGLRRDALCPSWQLLFSLIELSLRFVFEKAVSQRLAVVLCLVDFFPFCDSSSLRCR